MKKLPTKPNPWKTISKREVYENNWIQVEAHETINPNGGNSHYGRVHFKNTAIGIIPLDKSLNTWIVGQWRYPLGYYSWEIPMGGGIIGEDNLESAKRELLEEVGITAKEWEPVIETDLSNSVSDEKGIVFVAQNLSFQAPEPDEEEDLCILKLPFQELYERTINGEIRDGLAVAGILRLKLIMDQK